MIMRALIIRKFEDICPREREKGRFEDREVLSDLKTSYDTPYQQSRGLYKSRKASNVYTDKYRTHETIFHKNVGTYESTFLTFMFCCCRNRHVNKIMKVNNLGPIQAF